MTSERRYLWIAMVVVAVVALGMFLVPRWREDLAPEPYAALVAVEVDGSGVGEIGRIHLRADQRFKLHAVLVARDRQGEDIYYAPVAALRLDGRDIDPARRRLWSRPGEIAILWFTVEGFRPFSQVESIEQLEKFRFEAAFRPEWGRGWTIPGTVAPRNHALARGFESGQEAAFGTARFHIRIEKYRRLHDAAPLERYSSPDASTVHDDTGGPTMVEVALPGNLRRPSAVFGTPQLEPTADSTAALAGSLGKWYSDGLSFTRLLVLGGMLADLDLSWPELEWEAVDLEARPAWGRLGVGDLLRSGERTVVLFEDRGTPGVLDYDDLCIDLAESAAVRRLGEIFTGGGVLDWTDLEPATEAGGETS